MSDPVDMLGLATHGATGIGSGGVAVFLMRALLGRETTEVSTRLAVIEQQLAQLVASAAKHDGLGERVALLEASLRAYHERMDGLEKPRRKR